MSVKFFASFPFCPFEALGFLQHIVEDKGIIILGLCLSDEDVLFVVRVSKDFLEHHSVVNQQSAQGIALVVAGKAYRVEIGVVEKGLNILDVVSGAHHVADGFAEKPEAVVGQPVMAEEEGSDHRVAPVVVGDSPDHFLHKLAWLVIVAHGHRSQSD